MRADFTGPFAIPIALLAATAVLTSVAYHIMHREWVLFRKAEQQIDAGLIPEAHATLVAAEQAGLRHPGARRRLAEQFLARGDFNEARRMIEPLLAGPLTDPGLVRLGAGLYDQDGRPMEAAALYLRFQREGGALGPAEQLELADLQRRLKDHAAAEALYRSVIPSGGAPARRARLHLAEMLAWNGRFPESIALYRDLLQQEPNDRATRLGLARVLDWSGQHAEAVELYQSLLKP